MSTMRPFEILKPMPMTFHRTLMLVGAAWGRYALLVSRDASAMRHSVKHFLRRLEPFDLSSALTTTWPGTTLCAGDTATVFRFDLTPESATLLGEHVSSIFDWLEPEHLEDLCFLRADGSAWFTSITHERDAFLTLTSSEARALAIQFPDVWGIVRESSRNNS